MRVAIFHDWLVSWRGGEKCLEQILSLYEGAEVYTLFLDEKIKTTYLGNTKVSVGFLGRLPFVSRYYRLLLLLFPLDILYLSRKFKKDHEAKPYDLVISISHCAVKNISKNISVPKKVPHICYCLTPMRYIWDQYERYFSGVWYEPLFRAFRGLLQRWDVKGSEGVDHFIAISDFIAQRIRNCYGRESTVVYPPVSTNTGTQKELKPYIGDKKPSFLMVNALVPYKNTKLVVESFRTLPYTLRIVGSGPDEPALRRVAPPNVLLLGRLSDYDLSREYQNCSALIYAAEEDFGIVPVEAQAEGKPVICYAGGGCLETVVLAGDKRTGVSFKTLSCEAVQKAVNEFVALHEDSSFKSINCVLNAERFSEEMFCDNFKNEVELFLKVKQDVKEACAAF